MEKEEAEARLKDALGQSYLIIVKELAEAKNREELSTLTARQFAKGYHLFKYEADANLLHFVKAETIRPDANIPKLVSLEAHLIVKTFDKTPKPTGTVNKKGSATVLEEMLRIMTEAKRFDFYAYQREPDLIKRHERAHNLITSFANSETLELSKGDLKDKEQIHYVLDK